MKTRWNQVVLPVGREQDRIGAGSVITNTFSHGIVDLMGIAFALGLGLAIMVTIFAPTSGGHINPAVTVGFLVTRRIAPLLGLLYIVAQLVGATRRHSIILREIYNKRAVITAHIPNPLHIATM